MASRCSGSGSTGSPSPREVLKWIRDICGSLVAVCFLFPLIAMLAVAVKLDSHGPVLSNQAYPAARSAIRDAQAPHTSPTPTPSTDRLRERNEAEGGQFKISGDPRITGVDRLLRRTSLGELAQLFQRPARRHQPRRAITPVPVYPAADRAVHVAATTPVNSAVAGGRPRRL
jgi:lipopolysaccharide/colanic/teichoic acid biosynthesis glycosyltransferase